MDRPMLEHVHRQQHNLAFRYCLLPAQNLAAARLRRWEVSVRPGYEIHVKLLLKTCARQRLGNSHPMLQLGFCIADMPDTACPQGLYGR